VSSAAPAASEPAAAALSPREAQALFAGLERFPLLLLGVSGGPDSVAMMRLAASWAEGRGGSPNLRVATFDHGLRAGSRAEAEAVGEWARRLGLPHAILTPERPLPRTRLQEKARAARYGALTGHARAIGAGAILTAHHADDQAETVLMRLARGSGVGGLAAMRPRQALDGLVLARPLIGVPKARLVATCEAAGAAFFSDPSNENPAFARARLRGAAAARTALGLDTASLCRLAARAARVEEALEAATQHAAARLMAAQDGGSRLAAGWAREPAEIRLRLLARAIAAAGGGAPRLERLETLEAALAGAAGAGEGLARTLGGTLVRLARDGSLGLVREPARRAAGPAATRRGGRDEASLGIGAGEA
jgi:tRNA(Ile)-lysidine synthase